MFRFSSDTEKILTDAGWYPTRSIPIRYWIDHLMAEGYSYNEMGASILKNLGSLEIRPRTGPDCAYYSVPLTFDPLLEGCVELELLKDWEKEMKSNFFPLGVNEDDYRLVIDNMGLIFLLSSDEMYLCGNSIQEAMDVIVVAASVQQRVYP